MNGQPRSTPVANPPVPFCRRDGCAGRKTETSVECSLQGCAWPKMPPQLLAPLPTPTAQECPVDDVWVWTRFHANLGDWRPIYKVEDGHPGLGPYWCSGYGDNYSTICAWVRPGTDVTKYWPEATNVTQEEPTRLHFSDRFPEPEWWATAPENPERRS